MIAQDINQYKSYSHANSNSYVLTCTITCIHTLYTCIRILNCKLTFVWQSGQCRKSTLPTVHNCCLGSTRSVGRAGQGPPETPTKLRLHEGITDIHGCGYGTRKHYLCYFRGGTVNSFPSLLLFSALVVGYNCLTNITICIKVLSPIQRHIEYGVHKV